MRDALVKMLSLVWEISVETGDNATRRGHASHRDADGTWMPEEEALGPHWRDWGVLLEEGAS